MSAANLRTRLVLASASARRLSLLAQIGVEPDDVIPADLDETPLRSESARALVLRLSREKASASARVVIAGAGHDRVLTLAADTVVCVGRRILPKCEIEQEAGDCLRLLSGRAHRVYTGLTLIVAGGAIRERLVETRVRFKRLSREEIDAYISGGEWRGKAGGYAIQGYASAFVLRLIGSYSNVVGLPLAETAALLTGEGYAVYRGWRKGA